VTGGDSAQFEFIPHKLYRQSLAHVGDAHPVAMVRRLQQNVAMRERSLLTAIGNGTGKETPVMLSMGRHVDFPEYGMGTCLASFAIH
jgi:hypothetical protein